MRPTTILLVALTAISGVGTIVLAVAVGPSDTRSFIGLLRAGTIVTLAFGAAIFITVTNRRRRDRLRDETEANPGAVFVNAHATESTWAELRAWNPDLEVHFPCDLGVDRDGMTSWSTRGGESRILVATRHEITGFEPFHEPTPLGSTNRWGIAVRLEARSAGPALVHLWLLDGQPNQDEYAMRGTIGRIERALGPAA